MPLAAAQRRVLLSRPLGWVACGFGSGLAPAAPGTVGSAAALLPYLLLRELPVWAYWLVVLLVFLLGVSASDWTVRRLRIDDPGVIVIDEWAGQWITLGLMAIAQMLWPAQFIGASTLAFVAIGFVTFRLCDILKPWPASWADRTVGGGWGVMLDDALAGLWAGALGIAALWGWRELGAVL